MNTTKVRLNSIPMQKLKPININPKTRIHKKSLVGLKSEISKSNLIVPLITMLDEKDNKYWILDGNRRYHVMQDLGVKDAQCNIVEKNGHTTSELFVSLNHHLRMNGYQRLIIMKESGIFFNKKEEIKYNWLLDIGGSELIDLMIEKRNNVAYTHHWINQLSKYLGQFNKDDIKQIAFWIVENKQQYQTRKAIESGISKHIIKNAIQNNIGLKGLVFN